METDDIQRSLGRLESKQDAILDKLDTLSATVGAQETRIGSLERWRATLVGAWLVASTVLAWVAGHVFSSSTKAQ